MVVELFGPPGAGKTTLARALATRLRESGRAADVRLSVRPSEAGVVNRAPDRRGDASALLRRLSRPISEMMTIASHPFANSLDFQRATQLAKAFPSTGALSCFREWQYLARLSHSWRDASAKKETVIFDQGFVQALCSLLVTSDQVDDRMIVHALKITPTADLTVLLKGRDDLLEVRLRERRARQSRGERALERDIPTCIGWSRLTEHLHRLLVDTGRTVAVGYSFHQESLTWSARNIETLLAKMWRERERSME